MQLQDLLYGVTIKELVGKTDREINALNFDSRKVGKDDVFFAIVGTLADGHQFIGQTIQQGAAVIICENLPEIQDFTITYIKVENTSVALGIIAGNYFGNPSADLKLIGITGTNGKTTIATILFKLFKDLGYKTGLL